jgi:hypothetical protein
VGLAESIRTESATTKIWNRVFVSVFVTNMAMNLGQHMTLALVAKYTNYLGYNPERIFES